MNSLSTNGGELWLRSGTYTIDSTIVLKDGVSIKGVAPKLNMSQACPDLGFALNGGTQLVASSADFTCFTGNNTVANGDSALTNVFLESLGFKGFQKCIEVGSIDQLGLGFGGLRDIFIDGQDGASNVVTDIGIELWNCQQMHSSGIYMYDVTNGLRINQDIDTCSTGP
jgi:hypothetical protein